MPEEILILSRKYTDISCTKSQSKSLSFFYLKFKISSQNFYEEFKIGSSIPSSTQDFVALKVSHKN